MCVADIFRAGHAAILSYAYFFSWMLKRKQKEQE
jgi:hypothetical protein